MSTASGGGHGEGSTASTAVEAMSVWVSIILTTMEMEQGSIDGEGGGAANWANDDGDGGNGSAQPC